MTYNRLRSIYRVSCGALILVALYFQSDYLFLGVITILFMEGITARTIPLLALSLTGSQEAAEEQAGCAPPAKADFMVMSAERAWRLLAGGLLLATFLLSDTVLWFFPWFMGFAILGAGVSGVCPMHSALRYAGLDD